MVCSIGRAIRVTVTPLLPIAIVFLQACGGGGGDDGGGGGSGPAAGGGSQAEIRDLGVHRFPLNGEATFETQVTSASSFSLIADGNMTQADIDIDWIVNQEGLPYVRPDPNDTAGVTQPIGRNAWQAAGDSLASGTLPHTPHYGISEGVHRFRVRSFNAPSDNVRVWAIINHRGDPQGGNLDVNFIFCGIPDLHASNAPGNPNFLVVLNEFRRIFALANIQVNVVGHFDCDPSDQTRFALINIENGELRDLLATSQNISNRALNFFFVRGFEDGQVLGVAGKIGGPPLIQGTRYSGVVVSTLGGPIGEMTQEDLLLQGSTVAHEGAHYLGLYHPTEAEGSGRGLVDPIGDTPECPASSDLNGNEQVSAAECRQFDGANLMFWTSPARNDQITQEQLTPGQKFVLYRNPYVY